MGVSVFRRVQEGHHGEPAITRERKHFSKIHESDCKPSTCLACSYLNWREEVSAALCSAVNRTNEWTNERTNDITTTVQQLMMAECPNTWLLILIGDPMNLTTIVIFTGVPLYQLINHYLQRYIPTIFKRMGLGLLCCLLKVTIEIALQVTQKQFATKQLMQ